MRTGWGIFLIVRIFPQEPDSIHFPAVVSVLISWNGQAAQKPILIFACHAQNLAFIRRMPLLQNGFQAHALKFCKIFAVRIIVQRKDQRGLTRVSNPGQQDFLESLSGPLAAARYV